MQSYSGKIASDATFRSSPQRKKIVVTKVMTRESSDDSDNHIRYSLSNEKDKTPMPLKSLDYSKSSISSTAVIKS